MEDILMRDRNDEDSQDYIMNGNSCWITVGNVSLYIHRNPNSEILYIEACRLHKEMGDPIDRLIADCREEVRQ